jgi:hypothetical protein
VAEILAPRFKFFRPQPEIIGERREGISEAVGIGVGYASFCKGILKDSPDRRGVAPVLARQPNGDKALIGTDGDIRCRKERIVIAHPFSFRRKFTHSTRILTGSSPTGKKQVVNVLLRVKVCRNRPYASNTLELLSSVNDRLFVTGSLIIEYDPKLADYGTIAERLSRRGCAIMPGAADSIVSIDGGNVADAVGRALLGALVDRIAITLVWSVL